LEYLTTTEAARILKMTPKTFTYWLEQGKVPGALKLHRQWRVTPEDLKALLKPAHPQPQDGTFPALQEAQATEAPGAEVKPLL